MLRNKKENTSYSERRIELKSQIREIYDESRQLFGSEKINAVLKERGYKTTKKMVLELMKEMNISSLRSTTRKEYEKQNALRGKKNLVKRNFTV